MEVTRQVVKEGGHGPGSLSTVLRVAGGNNRGGLSGPTKPQGDCQTELVVGQLLALSIGWSSFIQGRVPYFPDIRVHEFAFMIPCFHSRGRIGSNFL